MKFGSYLVCKQYLSGSDIWICPTFTTAVMDEVRARIAGHNSTPLDET